MPAKVKTWVADHAHEIELFYLPAYAPDHNPDEYLNNDLKQKLRQQPQPATKDELIKNTRAVLRAIQRSPQRIQGLLQAARRCAMPPECRVYRWDISIVEILLAVGFFVGRTKACSLELSMSTAMDRGDLDVCASSQKSVTKATTLAQKLLCSSSGPKSLQICLR